MGAPRKPQSTGWGHAASSLSGKRSEELRPSQTPRTSPVLRSSHTFPSSFLGRASLRVTQQLFVCVYPEIFQAPLTRADALLQLMITKHKNVSIRTRIDGGTAYGLAKDNRGDGLPYGRLAQRRALLKTPPATGERSRPPLLLVREKEAEEWPRVGVSSQNATSFTPELHA